MAGGIDWFRWHHGSATDPKFRVVAKQAGCRTSDVVAVWAMLLEAASTNELDRGALGRLDFDAVDMAFDLEDGTAARIHARMVERGLISGGRVAAWDKRQPRRERDDDSTERVRRHRERTASTVGSRQEVPDGNATQRHVTPCNATQRPETPRVEESREERTEEERGGLVVGDLVSPSSSPASPPLAAPHLPESDNPPTPTTTEPPTPTTRATSTTHHPTPGTVVAHHPPPLVAGPWPDDPTTDDPVEWLRQHVVFGDSKRVRDPALVVQQIRNGWPTLDLIAVFREASDYLRSGQAVTAGYERHLKRTAQYAAERQARAPNGASSRRTPTARKPDNYTEADYAADIAAQEARSEHHARA